MGAEERWMKAAALDLNNRAERLTRPRIANEPGELSYGWALDQGNYWNPHCERLLDIGEHSRSFQRVPAEIEKIVIHVDLVRLKTLLPQLEQAWLKGVLEHRGFRLQRMGCGMTHRSTFFFVMIVDPCIRVSNHFL